jgi:DNA-binding transcriptional ArsR family regulator
MSNSTNRIPLRGDRLDAVFRALADPTRRALLARLMQGPVMITELAEPFDMSLPAISKHMKVLENARLVSREVDGRIHRCSLSAAPLREVERWLQDYRLFWEGALDELARYVDSGARSRKRKTKRVK